MMSGCGSTRVVTETETVEVQVDRLIPVDEELVRECVCNPREGEIWLDAAVIAIEYRQCWESCAQRMGELRGVYGYRGVEGDTK